MDREPEELQFLGFFGIYGEAYNIVRAWRHLFSQIAGALVVPLSFIFLVHIQISAVLFAKIDRNEDALEEVPDGSPSQDRILSRLASEWAAFSLFKGAYLLGVLIFSLLSTSAVVYTVACVYTAKDMTFGKVMSVVPKVWKRLMVTFLWNFVVLLGYNTATVLIIITVVVFIGPGTAGLIAVVVLVLMYIAGLVYISVVWHLASVVSVLEDACGIAAMQKSQLLIKGKLGVAVAIFLVLNSSFVGVEIGFRKLVVDGGAMGWSVWPRIGCGVLMLMLLSMLIMLGLVVQTVVYFVCKSYHHESIDKSNLADHLEVYLGEYAPLKEKDVQLEQFHV